MIFDEPLSFVDAMHSKLAKAVLPKEGLAELGPEVRRVAQATSRTFEADWMKGIHDVVDRTLAHTEGFNLAKARETLQGALREMGYQPPAGQRGRITDLSSTQRLNLIVETNSSIARGYGQFKQGQTENLLRTRPAQELYRGEDRKEPRNWEGEIWPNAAAAVDDEAAQLFAQTGRMVARKDSPIWMAISDFGNPFPPFKFNSGMWVRDVDAMEWAELGGSPDPSKPIEMELDDALKISAEGLMDTMRANLLEAVGDEYSIQGGKLVKR